MSALMEIDVKLPPKLIPVFLGEARYRGAYGGRGSAKTRSFAKMAAIHAHVAAQEGKTGRILCVREFMNSLDDSSMAEIKAAIEDEEWLRPHFDIGEKYIRTIDRRVEFSFIGLWRNLNSIKSKSKILLCWADEAETISETAWQKLIPTVREEGSEIWATWNPESEDSATHKRFRKNADDDMKIIELNYNDNPWFPSVLERERMSDKIKRPESYGHIWDGEFATYIEGAYFTEHLRLARDERRIGRVARDPLFVTHLFADIGGTGAKADNFVFWACQFIGKEVRVVDYYEVQGQPLAAHLEWLREKKFTPSTSQIWLPHDGSTHDRVFSVSYESAFRDAGYYVEVIPNQGKGAAKARIEAVRRLFPDCYFDDEKTATGRKALGAYHEKKDENRNVGLGPEHDWASHGSDAFGLVAIVRTGLTRNNGNDDDDDPDPRGRSDSTGY